MGPRPDSLRIGIGEFVVVRWSICHLWKEDRAIGNRVSEIRKSGISKSHDSCISDLEIINLKLDLRIVQFKLYDFGFEMQESCDFEIPDFLISDTRLPIARSSFH